jgi:hypothetical protein
LLFLSGRAAVVLLFEDRTLAGVLGRRSACILRAGAFRWHPTLSSLAHFY